jgi:alcohol dehydrogenase (cytochrome c)
MALPVHSLGLWDTTASRYPDRIDYQGTRRKVIIHADRNGYFYAIDRTNGRFLFAKPFVKATWAQGFTPEGRPIVNPGAIPTYDGVEVCPGAAGGKQWTGMAYSPVTRWAYIPAIENCATFFNYGIAAKAKGLPPGPDGFRYLAGQAFGKSSRSIRPPVDQVGSEDAIADVCVQLLTAAGGLVFAGDAEGNVVACDDRPARLWSYRWLWNRSGPSRSHRQVQCIAVIGLGGAVGAPPVPAPWLRTYRGGELCSSSTVSTVRPNSSTEGAITSVAGMDVHASPSATC